MDAVLFDLDGTLCAYRRHGREVLAIAFDRVGVDPFFGIEDYYGVYEQYAGAADTVEAQRELCFAAIAEDAGADPELGRAVARAFAVERDHADVAFLDGAEAAVRALAADHPLGLVTNGAPGMQRQKLEALGLDEAFDAVVYAGHDAPAKPAPEPFHRALDDLGAEPGQSVHVGNSLAADVAGARAAGLTAVWLRNGGPDGDAEPHHVIDALDELVDPPWA